MHRQHMLSSRNDIRFSQELEVRTSIVETWDIGESDGRYMPLRLYILGQNREVIEPGKEIKTQPMCAGNKGSESSFLEVFIIRA